MLCVQVERNEEALKLVAHTYLSLHTGLPCETPYGFALCSRPRRRAPQPEQQQAEQGDQALETAGLGQLGCGLGGDGSGPGAAAATSRRPSALAELARALAGEGRAATAAGPGTPARAAGAEPAAAPVQMDAEALLGHAPTPLLRAPSASPPAAPPAQPAGGRQRDFCPPSAAGTREQQLATRRSLFAASPPPRPCAAGHGAALLSPRMRSPGQRRLQAGAKRKINYAEVGAGALCTWRLALGCCYGWHSSLLPTSASPHCCLDVACEQPVANSGHQCCSRLSSAHCRCPCCRQQALLPWWRQRLAQPQRRAGQSTSAWQNKWRSPPPAQPSASGWTAPKQRWPSRVRPGCPRGASDSTEEVGPSARAGPQAGLCGQQPPGLHADQPRVPHKNINPSGLTFGLKRCIRCRGPAGPH